MFLFIGENQKLIIPENRLYSIQLFGNKISIDYDGGEITYLGENDSAVAPKVETKFITYDSEESALEVLRKFYRACEKKAGVFHF